MRPGLPKCKVDPSVHYNELHRRQCEEWNRKNKAVCKNNYLAKSLKKLRSNKHLGAFLCFHIKNAKSRFCQWK